MEKKSALLAICAGNSSVPGEFPAQRPVRRSFDVFFDLRLNKRLGKQSWGWWFETLSHLLWRHRETILGFPHSNVTNSGEINVTTQIANSMGPTWGPPGSCRPQMGSMLVPWTLLSGKPSRLQRGFHDRFLCTCIYMEAAVHGWIV